MSAYGRERFSFGVPWRPILLRSLCLSFAVLGLISAGVRSAAARSSISILAEARNALERGRFAEAAELYGKLWERGELSSIRDQRAYVTALREAHDAGRLVKVTRRLIRIHGTVQPWLGVYVEAMRRLGRVGELLDELGRMDTPEAAEVFASLLLEEGKVGAFLHSLEARAADGGESARKRLLRQLRALCSAGGGRDADAAYERYAGLWLKTHPDDAEVLEGLAEVLRRNGRRGELIEVLRRLVCLRPRDLRARTLLADMLADSGRAAEAVRLIESVPAPAGGTDPAVVWSWKVETLSRIGRPEDALRNLYAARRLLGAPRFMAPECFSLCMKTGRWAEAAGELAEACRGELDSRMLEQVRALGVRDAERLLKALGGLKKAPGATRASLLLASIVGLEREREVLDGYLGMTHAPYELFSLASWLERHGVDAGAERLYRVALESPGGMRFAVLSRLVSLLCARGRWREAWALLESESALFERVAAALGLMGMVRRCAFAVGKGGELARFCSLLLSGGTRLEPRQEMLVRTWLVESLFWAGRGDEAKDELGRLESKASSSRLVEEVPWMRRILGALKYLDGLSELYEGRFGASAQRFEAALRLDPFGGFGDGALCCIHDATLVGQSGGGAKQGGRCGILGRMLLAYEGRDCSSWRRWYGRWLELRGSSPAPAGEDEGAGAAPGGSPDGVLAMMDLHMKLLEGRYEEAWRSLSKADPLEESPGWLADRMLPMLLVLYRKMGTRAEAEEFMKEYLRKRPSGMYAAMVRRVLMGGKEASEPLLEWNRR